MSETITPAQLEATFGLAYEVPHHGLCIVLPADRFLPTWESQLKKLGYYIIQSKNVQHKPVILVTRVKPEPIHEEEPKPTRYAESTTLPSTVKVAKSIRGWLAKHPEHIWGDDEDKLLVRLWNKEPRISIIAIAKEVPNRSLISVYGRLSVLQKAGVISRRKSRKHQKPKPPEKKARSAKEKTATLPAAPTSDSVSCVFGWGKCSVRKLLAEENVQSILSLVPFCQACPKPRARPLD